MEGGEKGCYLHVNLRCFYSNCQSDQLCDSETTTVALYSVSSHLSHTRTHAYTVHTSKNVYFLCASFRHRILRSAYGWVFRHANGWVPDITVQRCFYMSYFCALPCSSGNTWSEFWECIDTFERLLSSSCLILCYIFNMIFRLGAVIVPQWTLPWTAEISLTVSDRLFFLNVKLSTVVPCNDINTWVLYPDHEKLKSDIVKNTVFWKLCPAKSVDCCSNFKTLCRILFNSLNA